MASLNSLSMALEYLGSFNSALARLKSIPEKFWTICVPEGATAGVIIKPLVKPSGGSKESSGETILPN